MLRSGRASELINDPEVQRRILDCDGIKRSKPYPSKRNSSSDLKTNADGSVDLYFGPEALRDLSNHA